MPSSMPKSGGDDLSHYSIGANLKTHSRDNTFSLARLRHWLSEQIIQDVPSQIAMCEFDCRKGCTLAEWEACENRCSLPGGSSIQKALGKPLD